MHPAILKFALRLNEQADDDLLQYHHEDIHARQLTRSMTIRHHASGISSIILAITMNIAAAVSHAIVSAGATTIEPRARQDVTGHL